MGKDLIYSLSNLSVVIRRIYFILRPIISQPIKLYNIYLASDGLLGRQRILELSAKRLEWLIL